ncbi:MAG: sugar phosphate isomerase/epimerase family protein [Verrucomicrobiota bacterium]
MSAARRYLPSIGLQSWTVRDELPRDLPGTLRAIKAAGYAQIELMRTLDAGDFVPHARELGLDITSAFLDWADLVQPGPDSPARLTRTLSLGRELALRYLVFGYIAKGARETIAQMKRHAAAANAFGRRCRDAGIRLCYHHHSFEFAPLADGRTTGWQVLLGELDPELVALELDTFWLAIAELDPAQTLRELRGRVAQVHLKDLAAGTPANFDEGTVPPAAFKELGAGCLDLPAILAACTETGVDQCHVEQDRSPDPLASIATSLSWLRRA